MPFDKVTLRDNFVSDIEREAFVSIRAAVSRYQRRSEGQSWGSTAYVYNTSQHSMVGLVANVFERIGRQSTRSGTDSHSTWLNEDRVSRSI